MLKETTYIIFILFLVLVIILALKLATEGSRGSISQTSVGKEGLVSLNDWDVLGMESVNKQYGFRVDKSEYQEFIDFLQNTQGIQITKKTVKPTSTDFPQMETAQCYEDSKSRTIKPSANSGQMMIKVDSRNPSKAYNECKAFANKHNYQVMGLEYSGECYVGNTISEATAKGSKPNNRCIRGKGYSHQAGGAWSQMVYIKPQPTQKNTVVDYENYIKTISSGSTPIKSWSDLKTTIQVNDSVAAQGFSTIEGATFPMVPIKNPQPAYPMSANMSRCVDKTDSQTIGKKQINNNIINAIVDSSYCVPVGEYSKFVQLHPKIQNINTYISTMKSHGINNEDRKSSVIAALNQIQSNYANDNNIGEILNTLKNYGLSDINQLVLPDSKPGVFKQMIDTNGLTASKLGIHIFPSTNALNANKSVFEMMKEINVPISDMGNYLSKFNKYGVTPSQYFQSIHPKLISDSFKYTYTGADDLRALLLDIKNLSEGSLLDGFNDFSRIAKSFGTTTYSGYKAAIQNLESIVGSPKPITSLVPKFTTYYKTVAYSDDPETYKVLDVSNHTITIDDVSRFISDMPTSYEFNTKYNFNKYIDKLTDRKYSVKRLKHDASMGKTYTSFMEGEPQQTSDSSNKQGFIGSIRGLFSRIEGFLEGFSTPSRPPDEQILVTFGITDFRKPLEDVEDIFSKNGLHDFSNGSNDWNTMINTIHQMNKLGIRSANLSEWNALMGRFGAENVPNWLAVLKEMDGLKLNGFASVNKFLTAIIDFGVNYSNNYSAFLKAIKPFGMDLTKTGFYTFLKDMKSCGLTYGNNPDKVNNIIHYFVALGVSLNVYDQADNGRPSYSWMVNSLCTYGKGSPSSNNLDDLNLDILNMAELYGTEPPIKKITYVDAETKPEFIKTVNRVKNRLVRLINGNMMDDYLVSDHLFQEEVREMIKSSKTGDFSGYTRNYKNQMMMDVGHSILKYLVNDQSNQDPQSDKTQLEKRRDLAYMCILYPSVMFEYVVKKIKIRCADNDNCEELKRTNPTLATCKASTIRKDLTFRKTLVLNGSSSNPFLYSN